MNKYRKDKEIQMVLLAIFSHNLVIIKNNKKLEK